MPTHAEHTLQQNDPLLGQVIRTNGSLPITARSNGYFYDLTDAIVSQQLSVKAAATIFHRVKEATGIVPERIAALDEADLRKLGLSRQKISYLKDLAQHFIDNPGVYDHLESLSDEEIIKELTAVRGIGTWTAQMFLLFALGREDIFAPDDLGLVNAVMQLYGFREKPSKAELEVISEKWAPYRSTASLHLWKMRDTKPL